MTEPTSTSPRAEALASLGELGLLQAIGEAVATTHDLPVLLKVIYAALRQRFEMAHFLVGLADDATGQLTFPIWLEHGEARSAPQADFYRDDSLPALTVRLRVPLTEAEAGLLQADSFAPGVPLPASYVALPLVHQSRAVGVLAVGSQRAHDYTSADVRLLTIVASLINISVEKTRLYATISRHARSLEERVITRTAELDREKTRFESTMQSLSEGLILFDPDGVITFANNRAQQLLGRPLEALLGLPAAAIWSRPDVPVKTSAALASALTQALLEAETHPTLTLAYPKPAEAGSGAPPAEANPVRDLALKLFPVRDAAGQLLGRGLILQDITHEREMDRMKDELVNVVSHELRTPLASVLGFAELLLTRDFPEAKRRQVVETIYKEADRLSWLINEFLDLRRLESGAQLFAFTEVTLSELASAVAANYALNHTQHTVVLDVPEALPPVHADPERLGQVIRNLLDNAIKYSPNGGRVTLAARQARDLVRLTVTDEGLGLPANAIPHLFNRFYRVDASDRREIGGTGLGLSIVKEIVKAHGGEVWVESPGPGRGSTFGVTLRVAASALAQPGARPELDVTAPAEPYVLVVEDDPGAVSLVREHLEAAGYRLAITAQPAQALELARQRRPVGVVLEVCLPDPASGWALLEELRRLHSAAVLPIIITSGLDEKSKGLQLGATHYLVKPFDPQQLAALLQAQSVREVLVVDDEAMILRLMRTILEKSGYRVRGVVNGQAALTSLETATPDLMILDLMMPGLDGFEVLERLRARPATRALPVLVMTAKHLDRAERERLQKYGAFLLTKSDYTTVRLRAAVEKALRDRWAADVPSNAFSIPLTEFSPMAPAPKG